MKWTKWIAMLCLLISLTWVMPVHALTIASNGNGQFLNASSAKKLLTDIKYYRENYPKLEEKNVICDKQVTNLNGQVSSCTDLLKGCNKDKNDLTKVSGDFEKKYIDTNKELVKCRDATPSRYVWFSYGVISTGIALILGMLLVR